MIRPCFAIDVIDDQGNQIHLDKAATRIISLAPDISEILFALNAQDQMIGVIKESPIPNTTKSIAKIGSYSGIDLEAIVALKPDLIVTWGHSFSRQLAVFQSFSIPVYVNVPHDLEDVARTMNRLGQLIGKEAVANQTASIYLTKLKMLKKEYRDLPPVKVFFQIGSNELYTINHDNWINQAIVACGGRNIFADLKLPGAPVDMEAVLEAAPQIIISDSRDSHWKDRWQRFPEIPAVKHQQLFAIDPDWIDRAGPRLLNGVEMMCQYINSARAL